jgi:hypothetical protein
MEKWAPIFWIIGICGGFFAFLLIIDLIKSKAKKGPD